MWTDLDPEDEAEACFLKAMEIAQCQEAKFLELRATMSLVRLRQQQALEQRAASTEGRVGNTKQGAGSAEQRAEDKLAEAHRMLSDVYSWFTEGFDIADLQEAKALMQEWSDGAIG